MHKALILSLTVALFLTGCTTTTTPAPEPLIPEHLKTAQDYYDEAERTALEADQLEKEASGYESPFFKGFYEGKADARRRSSLRSFQKARRLVSPAFPPCVIENFKGCCAHHGGVRGCLHYRVICKDGSVSKTCQCRVRDCLREMS